MLREKQAPTISCAPRREAVFIIRDYSGRDMQTSHRGLRINESDLQAFLAHLDATLDNFEVPATERSEVLAFINSTKSHIVE